MTIRKALQDLFENKWEVDKESAQGWSEFNCFECGQGHDKEQVVIDLESLFNTLLSDKVHEIEKFKREKQKGE